MSDGAMIRSFMAGLVDRAGGVDAAAALIGARTGADMSKGTISKRNAGHLDWPLVDIMALEDAVGDQCVRRWLKRTLPEEQDNQDLIQHAAEVFREAGEAAGAAMDLASGRGNRVKTCKEIAEAQAALGRLAAHVEGGFDHGHA